jgi:HlyD family secretion protein
MIRPLRSPRLGSRLFLMTAALSLGVGGSHLQAQQQSPAKGKAAAREKAIKTTPQERLRAQQLATRRAKAAYDIARATRELAEIDFEEYVGVGLSRELAEADDELRRARATLEQEKAELEKELDKFRRNPLAGNPFPFRLAIKKAEFRVEQAESQRKVLVQYTQSKRLKKLRSEVEKARSDELAKHATWEREKAKQTELERSMIRRGSEPNATRA